MNWVERLEMWWRDVTESYAFCWTIIFIMLVIFWIGLFSVIGIIKAHAETIDVSRLATAICRAENSVKYPYGIVSINTHGNKEYARKICVNTIRHALKDFKGGDFISFLGSRYCPVGAKNDPRGLNRNWISNVRRIYER